MLNMLLQVKRQLEALPLSKVRLYYRTRFKGGRIFNRSRPPHNIRLDLFSLKVIKTIFYYF